MRFVALLSLKRTIETIASYGKKSRLDCAQRQFKAKAKKLKL
jgi:hypothetical protein